jgi:hypothetical protein
MFQKKSSDVIDDNHALEGGQCPVFGIDMRTPLSIWHPELG